MHPVRLIVTLAATLAAIAVAWMIWFMQRPLPQPKPQRPVAQRPVEAPPAEAPAATPPAERPARRPAPQPPQRRVLIGQVTRTVDDQPIPGVTVRAVLPEGPDRITVTDAEGRYSLDNLPKSLKTLEFSATGYESETFERPAMPARDPEIRWDVVMAPAPGLYGQVLRRQPDGSTAPVADAWVGVRRGGTIEAAVGRLRRWRSEVATRTDLSGRFALEVDTEDNASGLWTLEARHAQHGRVREVIEGAPEITLILPGGGFISGQVVDTEGDPVPEFSVSASGLVYGVGGPKAQSFEEGSGRFRIGPIAEGRHTLWAVAPGFQPGERREVEVEIGQETTGVVITLTASMSLSGRVTDAETGRPIEGAVIQPAEWASRALAESVSAYSGADGRYRLPSLPGPRTSIRVQAEGYRAILAGGVQGRPGDALSRDFALSPVDDPDRPGSELTGIGAVLMRTREGIYVRKLVDGGPAAEVLDEGDVIVQVNEMEATEDLAAVVQAIRGEVGTEVDLWVKRAGSDTPERVTLRRDRVVLRH